MQIVDVCMFIASVKSVPRFRVVSCSAERVTLHLLPFGGVVGKIEGWAD